MPRDDLSPKIYTLNNVPLLGAIFLAINVMHCKTLEVNKIYGI